MSIVDLADTREVITAAATAEVPDDKPAICGTVTLHCVDDGEPLRLSMPMLDALFIAGLLASVLAAASSMVVRFRRSRGAERQQMKWLTSAQVGCSLNAAEYMTAQLQQQLDDDDQIIPSSLN